MAYIRYQGSPDVFDETTGRYVSDIEAQKIPNFDTQVKQLNVIRPDIKTETDFAKVSGTNVAMSPLPSPIPSPTPTPTPTPTLTAPPVGETKEPVKPAPTAQPGQPDATGTQNQQQNAPGGQIDATGQALAVMSQPVPGKFGSIIPTTPAQPTNANNQVYKDNDGNVFEVGSNRPVSLSEFKQRGLNIDHINRLSEDFSSEQPSGPIPINPMNPESSGTQFENDITRLVKALGLNDLKSEREKTRKDLADFQNKRDQEILEARDNPWVSAGLLEKQIQKINDRHELKLNTYTNLLKYQDSALDSALDEIKFIATGVAAERNKATDRAIAKDEALTKLLQDNPADYKEVQGGHYKIKTGKWVIQPKAGGADSITTAQQNATINQITGSFDNEPIVKEYNTISANVNFIKTAGTTPTDDISRIYAFAKVMDPNSVVREGEYKTVQDYSQALLENYGLKAKRVFDNAGFLTTEARTFLKDTLQRRLNTSEQQYKQVQSQFQKRIDAVKAGGFNTLTDYTTQFKETKDTATDITETINANKGENREKLIQRLVPVFPELSLDDISNYVYTLIPDKK